MQAVRFMGVGRPPQLQDVPKPSQLLGRNSVWTVVGPGGGHHDFHHGSTPYGTSMSIPYWGSGRAVLIPTGN